MSLKIEFKEIDPETQRLQTVFSIEDSPANLQLLLPNAGDTITLSPDGGKTCKNFTVLNRNYVFLPEFSEVFVLLQDAEI